MFLSGSSSHAYIPAPANCLDRTLDRKPVRFPTGFSKPTRQRTASPDAQRIRLRQQGS